MDKADYATDKFGNSVRGDSYEFPLVQEDYSTGLKSVQVISPLPGKGYEGYWTGFFSKFTAGGGKTIAGSPSPAGERWVQLSLSGVNGRRATPAADL